MKNLKVSMKLTVGFLIVTVLAIAIGVAGIVELTSAADNTALLAERTEIAIIAARMNRNIQAQRAAFRGAAVYHIMGRTDQRDSNIADLVTLENDYDAMHEQVAPMLVTETGLRLMSGIDEAYAPFYEERDIFEAHIIDPNISDEQMIAQLDAVAATVAPLAESVAALVDFADTLTSEMAVEADVAANRTTFILIIVLVCIAAIAIFLTVYISRLISKPLNDMMGYIRQAGETGKLQYTDEQWKNCDRISTGKDEISQTMKAFAQMLRKFVYYGDLVKQVASKDLTLTVETLGQDDTFGNAITQMLDDLNIIFAEITSATAQVNAGSGQIADGAQTLAQGATEQAATVQELSASVSEIAEKTKANARRADEAAKLAASIMQNADKGSHQMEDMIEAVSQINQSTQGIKKVMKSVQDIARQINILSLNAAVEAARAGVHGKGFAVVADAVRQLAQQSAEVTQESGSLIANSIEKAEIGTRIASETAASLAEIVAGISKSSRLTGEIAVSSEEQSFGITQINDGIGQVAQVVQQNSATAQESAAASEELNGQSSMLHELVAQFKLREKDTQYKALPYVEGKIESVADRKPTTALTTRAAFAGSGKY